MTREQAIDRVRKLRALAEPGRGGTPAERALARAKADEITRRFRLTDAPPVAASQRRPNAPSPRPRSRRRRSGAIIVGLDGVGEWAFNVETAEHSPNVTVKHYASRSNWRIEVDPRPS